MTAIEIDQNSFDEQVKGAALPVLLAFGAPRCGVCRELEPTLNGLAERYDGRLKVCKVNADANFELGMGHGLTHIPALFFYRDGLRHSTLEHSPAESIATQLDALLNLPMA